MRTLKRYLGRLISWATARRDEERLRAEIEEHLALQTADNVRAGLSPLEARRQAALKFGPVEAMKDRYREQKGLPSLERLFQDLRHTLRRLRMAPAFTISTVLTLALGIGATTSIFSLVHAVLLKSLPVANPAELYRLGRVSHCCYMDGFSQQGEWSIVSYDLYKYIRDNTKGFTELAAFQDLTPIIGVRRSGSAEPAQSYPGEFVSGNYFTMFGIGAYAGRALSPADDRPNAPPVAVMSYRLWQERYASDPGVVGSVFNLDDKPFTVVGIAPPGFFGDTLRNLSPDFFLPLNMEPYVDIEADLKFPFQHWLELIGRVKPGANPQSIEAAMRVNLKQWLQSHWAQMSDKDRAKFPEQTLYLVPGGAGISSMREQYELWLKILMLASGFVLLVVCANIANLMLVRGLERRQQDSLSRALGAPVSRVVRGPLLESILLSLFGGAVGLAIAFGATRLLLVLAFPLDSRPGRSTHQRDALRPRAPVRLRRLACDRDHIWHCSRVDGGSRRPHRSPPRVESRDSSRRINLAESAGRFANCALADSANRRGIADCRVWAACESKFRIPARRTFGSGHQSAPCRLSTRAIVSTLPAHPRRAREHSRRSFRGSIPLFTSGRRLGIWRLGGRASSPRAER